MDAVFIHSDEALASRGRETTEISKKNPPATVYTSRGRRYPISYSLVTKYCRKARDESESEYVSGKSWGLYLYNLFKDAIALAITVPYFVGGKTSAEDPTFSALQNPHTTRNKLMPVSFSGKVQTKCIIFS